MSKKSVNIIVIDDESHSRERIVRLISNYSTANVIAECGNGKDAIKKINLLRPHLIFLDIRLKDMTGFEVLKGINTGNGPLVIFVTAYDEYAIQAFDFFAFDYLLKPYEDERFNISIERAIGELEIRKDDTFESKLSELLTYVEESKSQKSGYNNFKLPIRLGPKIEFVEQNSIKYITASGYYVEIFTLEKKFLLRESLTKLISKLQPDFIRIHRSTIINSNYIRELEYALYGDIEVVMSDDEKFRVSKSYKKSFQNKFNL